MDRARQDGRVIVLSRHSSIGAKIGYSSRRHAATVAAHQQLIVKGKVYPNQAIRVQKIGDRRLLIRFIGIDVISIEDRGCALLRSKTDICISQLQKGVAV